jgi:hypothetical protein
MGVFKKIVNIIFVIVLSITILDACPDFSDNYQDEKREYSSSSIDIQNIAHIILVEVLNYHHNSKAHHCNENCNHSFEVDAFLPTEVFVFQPILKVTRNKIYHRDYQTPNQISLGVNPMPPASIC